MEIPKNIRQIGENNTNNRIYIEDYVITYLQQIAEDMEYGSRAILLLGHAEDKEETHCFYISGAVMSQKKRVERNEFIFDEADKEYLLEQKKLYFRELEILGWAVIENEFNKVYEESVWSDSADVFNGDNKLFCKISCEYNERRWYLNKNGIIRQIHGYAIFYDQNEKMQNYLILWYKEKNQSVTEEVSDRAAKKFRTLVTERQDYNCGKHPSTFFYILCTLLLMVVSVIGITTINQYDKMIAVENAMLELAQAMKENDELLSTETMTTVTPTQSKEETIGDETIEKEIKKSNQQNGEMTDNGEAGFDTEKQMMEAQGKENGADTENIEEIDTEENSIKEDNTEKHEIYCVQEGDTLAAISYKYYQTTLKVSDICQMNQIENPDNIVVGEKILLP